MFLLNVLSDTEMTNMSDIKNVFPVWHFKLYVCHYNSCDVQYLYGTTQSAAHSCTFSTRTNTHSHLAAALFLNKMLRRHRSCLFVLFIYLFFCLMFQMVCFIPHFLLLHPYHRLSSHSSLFFWLSSHP